MTQKLRQNQWAKAETESWWLSLAKNFQHYFWYLFLVFLPTQLGKHVWPSFSFVLGQRVDYLSPTLYVTDLLLLGLFLCVLVQRKLQVHPYFLLVILFISFSIFFSQSPLPGWYFLVKFLEVSFLVWYVAHESFNTYLAGFLVGIGVMWESLLAILQIMFQHSVGGLFYFLGERSFNGSTPGIANASIQGQLVLRPYATFSHPNMLAGFLLIGMLLTLFLLAKRFRPFILAVLLLGTIGLALSLSRAAFVTWVLVGVAALLVSFKERVNKVVLFLMLFVATVFLLTTAFSPVILVRFSSFAFGQSLTERQILAQAAFTLFTTHPFFGVGPNNFISSLPDVLQSGMILQPVHTTYLLIAAELGIPGILIYVGFFFVLGQKLLRTHRLPLFLAFFAFLFLGLFDHYFLTLQQGQLLTGIVIGLVLRETRSSSGTIDA